MKRSIFLLTPLALLSAGPAYSIDLFKITQELIQKQGGGEKEDPTEFLKKFQELIPTNVQGNTPQKAQAPTTSCEDMLNNSPKVRLIDQAAENKLKGIATGAAVGALIDKDRKRGAILGAISGAAAATAHTMWATKDKHPEDYDKTAKRLGYKPSQGDLLKIEPVVKNTEYKRGDYAEIVLRVSLLTPDKNNHVPVWINTYLVGENKTMIPLGSESYYVLPGTTPFVYFFPVCDSVKEGVYRLNFQITSLGRSESHEVELKVSSK